MRTIVAKWGVALCICAGGATAGGQPPVAPPAPPSPSAKAPEASGGLELKFRELDGTLNWRHAVNP